jgi:hypothetical protein
MVSTALPMVMVPAPPGPGPPDPAAPLVPHAATAAAAAAHASTAGSRRDRRANPRNAAGNVRHSALDVVQFIFFMPFISEKPATHLGETEDYIPHSRENGIT